MKCQTCQSEMQQIPAGVSKKTGKPYNAFTSCPNRCPKPSFNPQKPIGGSFKPLGGSDSPPPEFLKQENTYNQEIDKKAFGMCKYGFLIEAYKFLNGQNIQPTGEQAKQAEVMAEEWAEMSIRILKNTDKIPTGDEDFNQPLSDKIDQAENESENPF